MPSASCGDTPHQAVLSFSTWFRFVISPSFLSAEIRNQPYPGRGTIEDPFVVSWLDNDSRNPLNFPSAWRWLVAILGALSCFSIAFTSSAYTGGISGVKTALDVTETVAQLGVSLFVLGFAVGPLFWGPMSEIYGRQPVFMGSFGALVVCNALSASAGTINQLLVFRALAGEPQ